MRINLIIAQYAQSYDGQYMPNVIDAWDEFTLEDNQEGYNEALAKAQQRVLDGDYEAVRELAVIVPDEAVTGLFKTPRTRATVAE
jgi:hypothetical protein